MNNVFNVFNVTWTGRYPNLCSGEWIITYKGIRVVLPDDYSRSPMGTYGEYSTWHFEDWNEVFEHYTEGSSCEDWLKENQAWVSAITLDADEQRELFLKIQAVDWRHNSCGGCI